MYYPKIQMTELKNIPYFFANLEKFKKLISTKADEKYKEYRETENVEEKNQINEDITDLTFESIFVSELMSIFDGSYVSSYSRLYDYLIRFNIHLSTKVLLMEYRKQEEPQEAQEAAPMETENPPQEKDQEPKKKRNWWYRLFFGEE